jgi:hypothetical protein
MSFPKTAQLFSDATDKANFIALMKRQEGEFFEVKEGKLQTVSGFCNRYRYWKQEKWTKVADVVKDLMSKLDDEIAAKAAWGSPEWQAIRAELRPAFSKKGCMGRMASYIFDRKSIEGTNLDLMTLSDKYARVRIDVDETPCYVYVRQGNTDAQFVRPYHVELDLGTSRLNHTLLMLLDRKRGETFAVSEGKAPRLEKVVGCQNRVSYWWNKAAVQGQVSKLIDEVIGALDSSNGIFNDEKKLNVLRYTLQNGGSFTHLSQKVFKRGTIEEGSALEKALFPDLDEARQKFEGANKDNDAAGYEECFKRLSYTEFLFAQSLGIQLKSVSTGGTGGARYGYSRYGMSMPPIWVIKPSDEGPNGSMNPSTWQRVKSFFISQRTSLQDNSEACSEVDAAIIDRSLGTNLVPPTVRENVKSKAFYGKPIKECSLQMYVDGAKTLKDHLGIPTIMHMLPRFFLRWYYGRQAKKTELQALLPAALLERLSALNFATEDFDCHFDNALILNDSIPVKNCYAGFFGSGKNQTVLRGLFHQVNGVMLIKHDNGSSNPHSHPEFSYLHPVETHLSQRYRYLFEILPGCELTFSKETVDLLRGKEKAFLKGLEEKAKLALRSMTHPLEDKIFDDFWKNKVKDVRVLLFQDEGHKGASNRLVDYLVERTNDELLPEFQNSPQIRRYYAYHLDRIRKGVIARLESFEVLLHHLEKDKNNSIRDLLTGVRYESDFAAELKQPANKPLHDALVAAKAAATA